MPIFNIENFFCTWILNTKAKILKRLSLASPTGIKYSVLTEDFDIFYTQTINWPFERNTFLFNNINLKEYLCLIDMKISSIKWISNVDHQRIKTVNSEISIFKTISYSIIFTNELYKKNTS